ncbi:MAG: tryptophan-rich sensory protein, partial [Anaerolineales bacterium]
MKIKRSLMVITFLVMVVVNVLANALPINGLNTGEISDRFPILFVPAGYVFSIWGLIYLGLLAFSIYILTPKGRANEKIDEIAWWFIVANLFNTAWILLWHYLQFTLTLIPIFGLLISLLAVYLKLRIGVEKRSLLETMVVAVPFGIYLGWATVAVVANVTQVLYNFGWSGGPLSEATWAVAMLVVATIIGLLMIFTRREVAYPLVLTWAFVGIWVKQADTPSVAMTALIAGILLGVLAIGRLLFAR